MQKSTGMRPRRPLVVWIVGALTLIYGLGLWWVLFSAGSCVWAAPCRTVQTLRAMEINAVGDLLAGAFAPVAFLWLVAAVFIQSQELRAQRQELQLTREEMRLARSVAEATRGEIAQQAEAARQTARFMEKQAVLLEGAAEEASVIESERRFNALSVRLDEALLQLARSDLSFGLDENGTVTNKMAFSNLGMRAPFQARDEIIAFVSEHRSAIEQSSCFRRDDRRGFLEHVYRLVQDLQWLQSNSPTFLSSQARLLRLPELADALEQMVKVRQYQHRERAPGDGLI